MDKKTKQQPKDWREARRLRAWEPHQNGSTPNLNYFIDRVTQAFVEGINNAIRTIIRRAYGFRNFEVFRLHVLTQHGAT